MDQESDFRVRIGKIFDLGGFWVQQLICCVTSGVKADTKGRVIFADLVFPIWGVKERERNTLAEG